MKRNISFCVVLLAVTLANTRPASAREDHPKQVAAKLAREALTNSSTMDIVTDLTTSIGPRLDGSEAEKRAAAWAQKRFEQLGFDKVWIENFPLPHGWARGEERAEVVSPSPQSLAVTALGGSPATTPEGLTAEIALFKTYDELLAAPPGSLAGKIAVVTQPMFRAKDGAGYGAANKFRTAGPAEAARRGAIGYLLRSLATNSRRSPHTGGTHYAEDAPRIPAAALSVPDAEQLERLVAKGGPVRVKLVLTPQDLGAVTSQNVIAEIKGREKPDEIVLLGAHLDSWDLGTGAIDDGAGVAIVMAATKLIHDLPQHPKRTIRVVLFGSEETGLWGGKAYVLAHYSEMSQHIVVAEPDFGQGPIYKFQTGVGNPDEPSLKIIRAALAPLGIARGDNKSQGSSEMELLSVLRVPAVNLEMDGTDYFDLHHTADDTLDKIRPERINQSTAAYAVFAYLAAELGGDYRGQAAKPAK
ncbi:MAG: aminopeptidase precursor [Pedosphaera sp.]|nr:aminopeptidase precursor [Pedosphaera sp.]